MRARHEIRYGEGDRRDGAKALLNCQIKALRDDVCRAAMEHVVAEHRDKQADLVVLKRWGYAIAIADSAEKGFPLNIHLCDWGRDSTVLGLHLPVDLFPPGFLVPNKTPYSHILLPGEQAAEWRDRYQAIVEVGNALYEELDTMLASARTKADSLRVFDRFPFVANIAAEQAKQREMMKNTGPR